MNFYYNKAKKLIKENLFFFVVTIAMACVGGFCFFYFSASNNQSDWLANFYSPNVKYVVSQGNAISLIEWVFHASDMEGAKTFSLVLIYLCLLVIFLSGQLFFLLRKKSSNHVFKLLFTLAFGLFLFNPLNGINRVASPYLFFSALTCSACLFIFVKAKKGNHNLLSAFSVALGAVLNGLFSSTFSIFIIVFYGAVWVFSWIKTKKVSFRECLYLVVCLIANFIHYLPYFIFGKGFGSLHHPVGFGEFIKAFFYALSPNALGSFAAWDVDNSIYSMLGTFMHGVALLWGILAFALAFFAIVRALFLKRFTSNARYLAFIGLLVFTCVHIGLSSFNQFVVWDAATSLISLPLLALLIKEYKEYPLFPKIHFKNPEVLPTLRMIGLTAVIVFSSLGGFTPAAYNPPSFSETTEFIQMLTAGLPSEIALDDFGYSAIGGSQESSYAYANDLRKSGTGYFARDEITSNFFTSKYYYGTNDRVFEDGNFDGWVDSNFRVLLRASSNGVLKFDWYLIEDQLGGTMRVYADGVEIQNLVCEKQQNSLLLEGFEPDENYFIACRYDYKSARHFDLYQI